MKKSKKINTRKNRFKSFSFKLSHRQLQSLRNFSELKGSTPLKVIKSRIHDCIEEYTNEQIGRLEIPKNQLNLFKSTKSEDEQLELFN